MLPVEGLIQATADVLRREGAELALYSLAQGPQGYLGLRQFVGGTFPKTPEPLNLPHESQHL